jgi:hypothetical protein
MVVEGFWKLFMKFKASVKFESYKKRASKEE